MKSNEYGVIETKKGYIFKKDGNKLGKRKQKIAFTKYRDSLWMSTVHNILSREATEGILEPIIKYDCTGKKHMLPCKPFEFFGGFKRGEMAMCSSAQHYEDIRAHVGAIPVDSNKVIMVGLEDIPYNPMDEFDRPWMYDSNAEVAKLVSERHIPVVDDNYKYLYPESLMFNPTKPYYLETKMEDGNNTEIIDKLEFLRKHRETLKKTSLPYGLDKSEDLIEWIKKDSLFSMDNFNSLYYSNFNISNLTQEVDKILKESNQEVMALIKYGMSEYFKENDKNYKVIPINIGDIKISTEVTNDVEAYTTQQEALLKLLAKIKGKREYVIEYHIAPGTGKRLDIIKEITDIKEVIETKNLDEIKKNIRKKG